MVLADLGDRRKFLFGMSLDRLFPNCSLHPTLLSKLATITSDVVIYIYSARIPLEEGVLRQ